MASPDRPSPSLESSLDAEYAKKYRKFPEVYSKDGQLLGRDLAYTDQVDPRISLLVILMGASAEATSDLSGGKQLISPTCGILILTGILLDQIRNFFTTRPHLTKRTFNP